MKPFTCDESRGHLSDFMAGECGRSEAALLQRHLDVCEPCREFAADVVWEDRVIAELAGKARLTKMAGRIHAALESLDPMAVGEPERRRSIPWTTVAAAAFFLAALGFAAVLVWPSRDARMAVVPAEPKAVRTENGAEAKKTPEPEIPKPNLPDAPPEPEPKVSEPPSPPEPPKVPAVAQNLPAPEAPKRPEPNVVPEPPKAPVAAADAVKTPTPRPPDKIEVNPPRTVEAAINRGVAYLRSKSPRLDLPKGSHEPRPEELVLWTYFMAGVPDNDPEFQRLYKGIMERKLERTYDVALQAMLLEELDRVKYQWRIRQCAQFLVDNQCRNGQWSYGDPSLFVEELPTGAPLPAAAGGGKQVREFPSSSSPLTREKPKVKVFASVVKRREGPPEGDNSNSMYAALGLRACADAGILLPKDVLAAAERAWRDSFHDEGWCYGSHGHAHKPYASMTAGGVGSLVILDSIQGKDWKNDPHVKTALTWLAKNFSVTEHRGPPEHANGSLGWMQYYYMYALERAGILYGTEKVGTHDWYKEGVEALLDAQRLDDGSWISKDGGNPLNDTCFAILFLRRATRGLPPVATK